MLLVSKMVKLSWCVVLVVAACCAQAQVPTLPQLDPDEWWGPTSLKNQTDTSITSFTVKFGAKMIKDLKYRLQNHRAVIPPLEGTAFQYGFNQEQVAPWVKYWIEKYNFTKREQVLNKYPQYKTNIQGLDIHFIWVKPQVSNVTTVPLLLLHGWPGSVVEFHDVIPLLTSNAQGHNLAFEIVVPSLPGYGFSNRSVRPGLGAAQVGVILKNLMGRLGYSTFYIQGGDFGAIIGNLMATMFPKQVLGLHSNELISLNSRCAELQTEIAGVMATVSLPVDTTTALVMQETGYLHIFASKPDTIGICLSESPVALLAFMLEKFSTWTRIENRELKDGGLSAFSKDKLIDNLMIYWSTNNIVSSIRLYAETLSFAQRLLALDEYPVQVPVWKMAAEHEKIFYQAPNMLKHPHLLGITALADAGHFAALEKPEPFAQDVIKAIQAFMQYHNGAVNTEL